MNGVGTYTALIIYYLYVIGKKNMKLYAKKKVQNVRRANGESQMLSIKSKVSKERFFFYELWILGKLHSRGNLAIYHFITAAVVV
jgi:hypothetical protein